MDKIVLHQNTMPVMDATKYWAELNDDPIVKDLIEFIAAEWKDASGEIIVIGEMDKNMAFTEGTVTNPADDEFMNRKLISVNVTQYYNWNHTTNFDIIVD